MTVEDIIVQKIDAIDSRLDGMDRVITEGNTQIDGILKKQDELSTSLSTAWKKYDAMKLKMDRFVFVATGIILAASFFGVPERMLRALHLGIYPQ